MTNCSWKAHLETISACVKWRIESLASHELDALWLLTPEGDDWDSELEDEHETHPVYRGDVVDFLQSKILLMANDWTNARIRRYLCSHYLSISVENFPGVSVQKFPVGQLFFTAFFRCLKRN